MLHTVALDSSHKKASFSCEEQSLTAYLQKQASQDVKRNGIDRSLLPDELKKKMPYKNLPVTLLGRLARDSQFKGQGVGELLLADSLNRAHQASSAVASFGVVTDRIEEKARKLYESFGFISLQSGRMFITVETVKTSLVHKTN